MQLDQKNHDDTIDKTLAALKAAAPPQEMEARILQRLQQYANAAPAAQFRWRDLFAGAEFETLSAHEIRRIIRGG